MSENFIVEFQRSLRANLSFIFNKYEKNNNKIQTLINEVYEKSKNLIEKKNSKRKTHKIFSKSVLKIITEKKLLNFMRYGFIQQMFFIHNRLYLYHYLLELKKSIKWKYWKKLIKENNVGSPIKYFLYPESSGNKIFQIYHLKKYEDFLKINLKNIDQIIEFGGGYGNMAETFKKINPKLDYTIFDTPEVNLLQYYYLKRLRLKVELNSHKHNNYIKLINSSSILKSKFATIKKSKKKLFIANWSLSETPLKFRDKFKFIIDNFDFQLISFQKEFEGINNLSFFQKLNKLNLSKNRISKIFPIKKMNEHFYFFSKKN